MKKKGTEKLVILIKSFVEVGLKGVVVKKRQA